MHISRLSSELFKEAKQAVRSPGNHLPSGAAALQMLLDIGRFGKITAFLHLPIPVGTESQSSVIPVVQGYSV